jgi:hypothetical protein
MILDTWASAPDWANWLAMNSDGTWFWHQLEPIREEGESGVWWRQPGGGTTEAAVPVFATAMLEKRPDGRDNWTHTAENINALPRPLRDYIHRLEANTDPGGELQRAMVAEMKLAALERMIAEWAGESSDLREQYEIISAAIRELDDGRG